MRCYYVKINTQKEISICYSFLLQVKEARENDIETANKYLIERAAHARLGGRIPTVQDAKFNLRLSQELLIQRRWQRKAVSLIIIRSFKRTAITKQGT